MTLPPRPRCSRSTTHARTRGQAPRASCTASLHRGHVRRCRPRVGLRPGIPDVGRAARDGTHRPLNNQLHAGPNWHTSSSTGRASARPARTTRQEARRGLRAVAGPRAVGHRGGTAADDGRDPAVQAARVRASLRRLRTAGVDDERTPGDLLAWLTGRYEAVFTQTRTHSPSRARHSRSAGSRSHARRAAASSTSSC